MSPNESWLDKEDCRRGSVSLDERERRKNNLVIQSVLFFCTISWTPLTGRCESM